MQNHRKGLSTKNILMEVNIITRVHFFILSILQKCQKFDQIK